MNLKDRNLSYFIITSNNNIDAIMSILWNNDYHLTPITSYYNNQYEKSLIALSGKDNNETKSDLLFILNQFQENDGVLKYKDEYNARKVFSDGSEKPTDIVLYNTDDNNRSYIFNGLSFSFVKQKEYTRPSKKEDFKEGMLIEYYNNDKWNKMKVENVDIQWEDLFKLLVEYNKIRIPHIL